MSRSAEMDLSVDRDFTLRRTFDAPRALVWRCWTDPAHLAAWWGPHDYSARVELDLRPGGRQLVIMIDRQGNEHPIQSTYLDIVPMERITGTLILSESHVDDAAILEQWKKGDREHVLAMVMTVTFADTAEGGTLLTVTQTFPDQSDRDATVRMGALPGWNEAFEKLDALLESMS